MFAEFLKDNFVETPDETYKYDIMQMYKQFKEWHRNCQNGKNNRSKRGLEDYLRDKRKLKIISNKIYGIMDINEAMIAEQTDKTEKV